MIMPAIQGQNVTPSSAQLPVAIDYPAALALRQMALVQDELPKYLLAPCPTTSLICIAGCCWRRSGIPGRGLTKRWH